MELRDPFPRPPRHAVAGRTSARLLVFRVLVVVAFVVLAGRLWQLQIVQGDQYRLKADTNRFRIEAIDAPRGVIYDRNGDIVVRNQASFAVTIVPADLPEDGTVRIYRRLADLLDMPIRSTPVELGSVSRPGIEDIVAAGRQRDPYSPVLVKAKVPREAALVIEEAHLSLPGVRIETIPVREYTTGPLPRTTTRAIASD
jgi:penicillin-binding protein 2